MGRDEKRYTTAMDLAADLWPVAKPELPPRQELRDLEFWNRQPGYELD
jgi:hypothetical protein